MVVSCLARGARWWYVWMSRWIPSERAGQEPEALSPRAQPTRADETHAPFASHLNSCIQAWQRRHLLLRMSVSALPDCGKHAVHQGSASPAPRTRMPLTLALLAGAAAFLSFQNRRKRGIMSQRICDR